MEFTFSKLLINNAQIIADDWKYEGQYAFYDMTADPDDYAELVNEDLRNGCDYFEASVNGELVGFFAVVAEDDELEIGLGLRPDMCGKGLGHTFLMQIITYIDKHYSYNILSMCVATFNKRSIKVYESCGFQRQHTYMQKTNGGHYEFLKMIKQN